MRKLRQEAEAWMGVHMALVEMDKRLLVAMREHLKEESQKELAVKLDFTPQYINDVLRKRRNVSVELVTRILKAK